MDVSVVVHWLAKLIDGFASAWEWLTTPMNDWSMFNGVNLPNVLGDFTPLGIISFGGIAILLVFSVIKMVLDAIPLV